MLFPRAQYKSGGPSRKAETRNNEMSLIENEI